jgi:hypothetical protein
MLMLKSSLEETTTKQLDTLLLLNSNRDYEPTLHYNGNQLFGPVMTLISSTKMRNGKKHWN